MRPHDSKVWGLQSKKREKESEGWSLKWRERSLRSQMEKPEQVPKDSLQEFELSNVTRLGLVCHVQETYAERQTLDIPDMDYQRSIDLEIELVSDERYILTELGVLFVKACTEKRAVQPPLCPIVPVAALRS